MNFAEFKKTSRTHEYLRNSKGWQKALNACIFRWEQIVDKVPCCDCGFCIVSRETKGNEGACCDICPVVELCNMYDFDELEPGDILGGLYALKENLEYLK